MSLSDPQKRLAEYEAQRQRLLHSRQSQPQKPGFFQTPTGHIVTNMGMGFAMGSVVGSSVMFMHYVMSKIPINRVAVKNMAVGGASFGTIFAVGSLLR